MTWSRLFLVVALILAGILSRIIPHTPNFTAMGAAALFAGAMLPSRWMSLMVPLIALLVSDGIIGFHSLSLVVYAAILLSTMMGWRMKSHGLLSFVGNGIGSAVVFFLVTNFAVWAEGSLYPRTLEGLQICFIAALPFFKNMVLANTLFLVLGVSIMKVLEKLPQFKAHSVAPKSLQSF